jgi:hypothetical protein
MGREKYLVNPVQVAVEIRKLFVQLVKEPENNFI